MMVTLAGDLSSKNFQALLKGLIALCFFPGEAARDEITAEYLLTEVFQGSGTDGAQRQTIFDAVAGLLEHAASHDLSPDQLEEFLAGTSLSKEHAKVFTKVMARDRDRIHLATLQAHGWAPQYAGMRWRVTAAPAPTPGSPPDTSTSQGGPVKAVVSLDVRQPGGAIDTVPFQMGRPMLDEVMAALQAIQARVGGQ
eukprot:EG_transcript_22941